MSEEQRQGQKEIIPDSQIKTQEDAKEIAENKIIEEHSEPTNKIRDLTKENNLKLMKGEGYNKPIIIPDAWKKSPVEILELEKGIYIKVRKPKLENLLKEGILPKGLISKLMNSGEMFDKLKDVKGNMGLIKKEDIANKLSDEDFHMLIEMVNAYTCLACVEPKVTDFDKINIVNKNGYIDVNDIPLGHKMVIAAYCQDSKEKEYVDFFGEGNI